MMSVIFPINLFYSPDRFFPCCWLQAASLCTFIFIGAAIAIVAKCGGHHPRGEVEGFGGDATVCNSSLIFAFHALLLLAAFIRDKQAQHISLLPLFHSFFPSHEQT